MKHFLTTIIACLLCCSPAFSQSLMDKWPELKTVHQVVSQTFHPSEEGNLAPIKARSHELADKAKALRKSNIPEGFRTDGIKDAVVALEAATKKLDGLVKARAADETIKTELAAVHDTFHRIVGLCTKGGTAEEENH